MEFIPFVNVCQTELVYLWDGQVCATVLHYAKASPWTLDHMDELGDGIVAKWGAFMPGRMAPTIAWTGIKMTDLSSQVGPVLNYQGTLPKVGVNGNPSMPNSIALCVTKRTALRGRSYRGRIYHPGLVENDVTGNTVDSTIAGLIANAYENLISINLPVSIDEAIMVVASRKQNGDWLAEGIATPVTHMDVNLTVDSQRRRLPGRGS